jgi:alpha,alpha-trehalase
MFEKFSITDVDSSGRGGEYTVQAGFGWTNGVVLWVASTFGEQLVAPVCPDPLFAAGGTGSSSTSVSSSGGSTRKKSGALQLRVAPRQLFGLWLLVTALQFLFA